MIKNRPRILDIPNDNYIFPVGKEFSMNLVQLPIYLKLQLGTLFGILPIPKDIAQKEFYANPSKKEIHYHKRKKSKFQMINVVLNMHSCLDKNGIYEVYPYSLSLVPAVKSGNIELIKLDFLENIDLEKFDTISRDSFFLNYLPFSGAPGYIVSGNLIGDFSKNQHIDTIGFLYEIYILNIDANINKSIFPVMCSIENKKLYNQIYKYCKTYFLKPFKNTNPRIIWGAQSPIELFVIQGLARKNLFPIIQTDIFKDGATTPHFYSRVENNEMMNNNHLITSIDLFFEKEKLAIFCDGKDFHSGENEKKDENINTQLSKLGITILRFNGKEITEDLDNVIENIIYNYNKLNV